MAALLLVRPGEIRSVAHFFGLFVLLGAGIALGQGSAEALFFKRYGIHYLPETYIAPGLVLCTSSILYAAYADRFPAERVFGVVFPVLIAAVALAWVLMKFTTTGLAYPVYYLVCQAAAELLAVHAALYVSQNFELLQAKRLSALILAGSQVGIILGGAALPFLVRIVGVQNVLLGWTLLLVLGLLVIRLWHIRHGTSPVFRRHRDGHSGPLTRSLTQLSRGLKFMHDSPLHRADSIAFLFMIIACYILGYSMNRIYAHSFATEAALASFFGTLTATTSGLALLLQLLLTNRIIARFGVRSANLVLPLTNLLGYGLLLYRFDLLRALLGSFNKDVVAPAFREPARHVMREALPANMKGRTGATSVIVVLPVGLIICGSLLWVTQSHNSVYYLAAGAAWALLYLRYSMQMNKVYASEIIRHLRKTLSIPGGLLDTKLRGANPEMLRELRSGVLHDHPQVAVAFAKALLATHPVMATEAVLERAARAEHVVDA